MLTELSVKLRDARDKYNHRNTDPNKRAMEEAMEVFDNMRKKECQDFIMKRTANLNTAETREFWKQYQRIFSPKADNKLEALMNEKGELLTENEDIEKELFKTFFEGTHLSKGQSSFDGAFKDATELQYEVLMNNNFCDPKKNQPPSEPGAKEEPAEIINNDISTAEITHEIRFQKTSGKSFDKDNIHPKMLKHLGTLAIKMLDRLFNLCFKYAEWQWNTAEVIFLRKEGKSNYSQAGAYRPISISSYIGKLFEKICAKRLEYYFWRIGLFDEDQEGFTRARNTVRYLNRLNLGIKADLEKRLTVMCLFLDMEKAFDSVWKRGLIVKLSQVGVKGRMLAIIDAFLMNRSVRLNVNGFIGILRLCLLIGLPQGSVLSPILFKFFLYDLCEELIRGNYRLLKKYKFADDGSLKASGATTAICLENLMLIMQSLEWWCSRWRMIINCLPNKTEVVCYGTAEGDRSLVPSSFKLGSEEIRLVTQTKVLGLIMDENLDYKSHSDMVYKKLVFRWVTMCKYSNRNWGFNQAVVVRLTKTLFTSVMFYAGLVWMKESNMKEIKSLWYKLVKSGVGAVFNIKLVLGEVILGLPPLAVQQKVNSVKHYLKICIIPSDTDRLRQFVEDTNNLQVPELKSAMKEVFSFLKWKKDCQPECFTDLELKIISGKEFDNYTRLLIKACGYSMNLIKKYTEHLWQCYINNVYQMEGESRIPTVSCQSLHLPRYATRDQEVLAMSLFYKNNLMESFLYSIKRSESPLCPCGDEAQTAVHAILYCKLVPEELREEINEILGGKGSFYEDIVTFIDASRDADFIGCCINIFQASQRLFRTKIVLVKLGKPPLVDGVAADALTT